MSGKLRLILLATTLGLLTSALVVVGGGGSLATHGGGLRDEGVGMYTDPSVANQLSSFTINPRMVSCGVGTLGATGFSGPFAMLMFATNITRYSAPDQVDTIRATGRMRSVTNVGGATVENVEHDFIALAVDGDKDGPGGKEDRFDVHFKTPFWNTGNPLCTPSSLVAGGCRFGGEMIDDLGEVSVRP